MFSGSFERVPAALMAIVLRNSSLLSGFTYKLTLRQNFFIVGAASDSDADNPELVL